VTDAEKGRGTLGATRAVRHRGSWIVRSQESSVSSERAGVWLDAVNRLIDTAAPVHHSRHAVTYYWPRPDGGAYVKVYRRPRGMSAFKDCLRGSLAHRAARASRQLAAAGFRVPRVLAVAEERRVLRAQRAWLATAALAGEPVASCLARLAAAIGSTSERSRYRTLLRQKRAVLSALGYEVARLHEAGFVAGDLVPSNVWVAGCDDRPEIVLLDHDRTRWHRHGPYWWRARRNLVQLNRIVLIGVSVNDRLRVLRAYAEGRRWPVGEARRRLPWLIAKTAERRRRCDNVVVEKDRPVDFRTLMRPGGPYDSQRHTQTVRRVEGTPPVRRADERKR